EAAGIRPGDRIHSLNGEACGDLAIPELVARIKGKVGTVLHMEVEHATGELEAITVERRAVPRITVAKTGMLDEDLGIGLIHIRSFARSTPAELDQALDGLLHAGVKALVLDLRFNTGGLLDAAVDIASRFLEGGIVCRLEVRGGEDQVRFADPKLLKAPHIPIVILANRLSASGSEVLAGALKDRGAALLCGQRTFGKGVYQQVHRYRTGNFALKFTAGYYRTPSGRILEGQINPDHLGGLEPDLPVAIDAASNLALRQWLDYDAPPAKWRDQVQQLFPQIEDFKSPPDSALALALSHLRGVLSS
ncbi:MAG: S41 family peptidase, partial [Planctomycetes bacterium]|nr:S41 family peptidase [Planctomycetota bacterium]